MLMAAPRLGEPVAAFFSPAMTGEAAFRRAVAAGAQSVLGFGVLRSLIVAQSDDPLFIDNLYQSGAILVLRAPPIADCLR